MIASGVQTRNKLLVLCSLLVEFAGFSVIMQGRSTDGMLLVLFGMTFCMMIVFAGSWSPVPLQEPLPADHDAVRNELLSRLFRAQTPSRSRRA